MNFKSISAIALVAAFAGNAFAETPGTDHSFVPVKSRAEVQADLAQYQKSGVNTYSIRYNPVAGFRSAASRDAVTAAYVAARDEVAAITSEDGGSAYAHLHTAPTAVQIAGDNQTGQ